MKTCTRCGRKLPTTLDEYGPDLHAPLCVACWLDEESGSAERKREEELQAILEIETITPEVRREWLALINEPPIWTRSACVVVPARKEDEP
jgi:hypothetical protein